MKKNLLLIVTIFVAIVGLLFIAFRNPVNKSYEINEAGYTYSPKGAVVKFSKQAKYNNTWINNEKVIEDQSKKKTIDLSRTLFLENQDIQFLGKSVAVVSNQQLDELPSFTHIQSEKNNYLAKTDADKTISTIPKGTVVKLAEGRYIILDSANLQNTTGLNKKLKDNSIVVIDDNKKIRIDGEKESEEMTSDDLFIIMENSDYRFDLTEELLVNVNNEKDQINVKEIKVEIDDPAGNRQQYKTSKETSETEKNSSEQEDSQESSKESELSESSNQPASETANSTNNKNGQTQGDGSGTKNSLTDEQIDEINDVINKLNNLEENPSFVVPIVNVEAAAAKKKIKGSVTISDSSARLEKLTVLLKQDGKVIQQQEISVTATSTDFSFENLEYGSTYQLLVEGSYKYNQTETQLVTFYRKTFTLSPVKIDKKIIANGSDSLSIQLKASDQDSHIDELVLRYKINNSQVSDVKEITVNAAELNDEERTTVLELTGLESNQEYLIEMARLVVDGQEVTDSNWYLIGKTKKQLPVLEGLLLEYSSSDSQFIITPRNLTDLDETITNIRYLIYSEADYEENGSQAEIYASATVNSANKNSVARIGRTVGMTDGSYVAVACVMGNDDQSDYELPPVLSNSVVIGMKIVPRIEFALNEAKQDSLDISYELFDQDETLIINALSKPVFNIYLSDANGNLLSDTPIQTITINSKEEITNQLFVDKLKSESYYVATLTASYNLDDGNGIQANEEIGRSKPYKTLKVQAVTATFTQIDAEKEEATANVKLDKLGAVLTSALLEVKEAKSGAIIQTIEVSEEMLEKMLTKEGLDVKILDLEHNSDYQVSFVEAYDSGENEVTVNGTGLLKTRKIAPEADRILLNYVQEKGQLGVIAAANSTETIVDEDAGITSITFQLFEADDLAEDENAAPLAEKVIMSSFDTYTYFDLLTEELGRGKKYIVRAVVNWNDRFDDYEINLQSDELAIDKKLPEVEFQVIKRDAAGITMKAYIDDDDSVLENNEITISNGTEKVKVKNEQEFTIPAPSGVTIQAIGDYRLLEGEALKTAVLQEKKLLPLTTEIPTVSNQLSFDESTRRLLANAEVNKGNSQIMASEQKIEHNSAEIFSGFSKGTDALRTQSFALPNREAAIWFDDTYDFSLATAIYYSENQLDNLNFAGQYNFVIDDTTKVVSSTNGIISTSADRSNASVYELSGGSTDAKGNIQNVSFKNVLTGKYLGINTGNIVDNETAAYAFSLERLANGSYVLTTENRYINFSSGVVSNKNQASTIDLYSANYVQTNSEQQITLPKLTMPTAEIDQLSVYDKKINMDFLVTDTDTTILKDGSTKLQLYVNVYEEGATTPVKSTQLSSLTDIRATISDLIPVTAYTVKIEAVYDLLEETGSETAVLASKDFTTLAAAPEITKTTYTWSPSVYVENGRKIVNTTEITDESNILDTIEYRLYELTSDIQYSTNVEKMEAVLANKTPITVYDSSEKTNNFDLYDENGQQRFVSGKTYIIAAYVKTTKPAEVPDFLGNVNSIAITVPATPTTELQVENVTSKMANVKFSYNDPHGYILSGNSKPFKYLLTETDTGNPATYVEGYTGSFTGTNASTWLKNFQGLNPSTGYTLTITANYDNLNGQGSKSWTKQVVFTTSDEYVTSNPLIYILNGNDLTLKVSNLNNGSATITASRLVLYKYNAQTNTIGAEVASKTIPVASSYPIDINEVFDISTLMSSNEYLMASLEVTYDTDLGEKDQVYTIQNVVYVGAVRSLIQPLNITTGIAGFTVQTEELPTDVAEYTVIATNERGQTVANTTATSAQFAETLTVPTSNQAVQRVEIMDNEKVIAAYQTNQFEDTVTAYYTNQEVVLKKSDASPSEKYEVTIQGKETSLADRLLKTIKEGLVFKTATLDAEQFFENGGKGRKVYEINGTDLSEGYTLPYSINQYDITIKEVKTGNELVLQPLEVLK
ncbi:hypothetical protein GIX45_10450 [Erwinia sp. CPCC 100877]|nr:hypothetical protein [Erwinia sp. CPCC 100877]